MENSLLLQRSLKEMTSSLKVLLKSFTGETASIDNRVKGLLNEIEQADATFVFVRSIENFIRTYKNEKFEEQSRLASAKKEISSQLAKIDVTKLAPTHRDCIVNAIRTIRDQAECTESILEAMANALTLFSQDAQESREGSRTIVGKEHSFLKHNENDVVAADIKSASKRLARDVTSISHSLLNAYPTDDEIRAISNESKDLSSRKDVFFKSLEMMGELSLVIKNSLTKKSQQTQEMLSDIQKKVVSVFSHSEVVNSLSDESDDFTKSLHQSMTSKLQELSKKSENSGSSEESHKILLESVDAVNALMEEYVKQQQRINLSSKNTIKSLQGELDTVSKTVKKLKTQINQASDELLVDELTQVGNRRGYLKKVEELINLHSKGEIKTLSLIVLDIDKFKSVNDNYGHAIGDQVIKKVAKLASEVVGSYGYFARYGGEEFVIVMPNFDAKKAALVAQKVRKCINARTFTLKSSTEKLRVTLSAGVCEFEAEGEVASKVFDNADSALYKAKEAGRNRTVISSKNKFLFVKEN